MSDPTHERGVWRGLLRQAFPGAVRPWWRDARLRRHAGPDLLAAATCALMLLPALAGSSLAEGMGKAVAVQCLLAFFDLPIVWLLATLAPPRVPRAVTTAALLLAYALEAGVLAWYVDRVRGVDLGFVLLLVLPVVLRAVAMVSALKDGESAAIMAVLSLGTLMPWMLSMLLVAVPMGSWFGFQQVHPGTDTVTLLPPAWNAMGVLYFALVALMRWFFVLQAAQPRRGAA